MKKLRKKGLTWSLILAGLLGFFLIFATIPIVKYIKDTSDTKMFKEYGVNPEDEFMPADFDARATTEDKIAMGSFDFLKQAINALAENKPIPSTSTPITSSKPLQITFDGQFEAEVSGLNIHKREPCTSEIKQEGPIIIDCKQYFDIYSTELKNKEPYDIDYLYSFVVIGDKDSCPGKEYTYPSEDLKARGTVDDCSNAPNYVISNGYKISYCGKAGWKIKINVQKVSDLGCTENLKERDNVLNWLGDKFSNTGKLISSSLGFKPDQVSNAFCDNGEKKTIGNTTLCLRCDNTRNKCDFIGFELPQNITKKEAEPWIVGYGDPKWVLYYESFPQGEEQAWQISKVTMMSTVLAYSSVALDSLPLVGRIAKSINLLKPLVEAISKLKTKVYDATIGKIFNGVKNSLPKLFTKNIDEIGEIAIEGASKIGTNVKPDQVILEVNKNIIKGHLDNVLVGTIKDTDSLADDISKKIDFSKYLDKQTGKISEEGILKYTDEVANIYRQSILANKQKYIEEAAFFAEENARKLASKPTVFGDLSEEGIAAADRCCKGPDWKKAYDNYFKEKGEKEITKKIDDGVLAIKNNLDDSIRKIDYQHDINDLVFRNTLNAQERKFYEDFNALFKKTYEGGTLKYKFDDKMFAEVSEQVEKGLANMNTEAKERIFKKAREMSEKYIKDNDLDFTKILTEKVSENPATYEGLKSAVSKVMIKHQSNTQIGNLADIYSGVSSAAGNALSTTPGQVVSGAWNRKERLVFAGIIAVYSAQMDAINEKYVPAGYNKIAISQLSIGAQRKEVELSPVAKDLFIRLDKENRDGASTNRLFFASPCKTDLDIRKQRCTCSVETVVERNNGQWTGYLKKTGNSYIPVKNVKAKTTDYDIQNFKKTDTRTMSNQIAQGAILAGLYSTISSQLTKEYPVLKENADISFAIKECQTRGWWDSQVFAFNNVDVETDCISISETDSALAGKYNNYNGGYNFCYSGDNYMGEALKGAILIGQIGITMAAGAPTAGLGVCIASPISNIIGAYLTNKIDENSKWPSKNFNIQSQQTNNYEVPAGP